jgi:hypothetical protein
MHNETYWGVVVGYPIKGQVKLSILPDDKRSIAYQMKKIKVLALKRVFKAL